VEAWVSELCQRFGHGPIAVAVEQVKDALVYMLRKYECLHLYPVPSTMSASMREALYPSGAKDDPRDADLLLELLVLHRDKLRRWTPDNEATRRVQNLVEERRKLVEEKTAQLNRLTGYLKVYFPQMLEWFAKLDSKLVCDVLERWPSLEELQRVPSAELKKFFRHRRGRQGELTEWRMQGISQAMPAIRDRAVIEAKQTVVQVLAQLLRHAAGGDRDAGPKDRRGGRGPSGFFHFPVTAPEPAQPWRRACWPLWVRNEIAMRVRPRYRNSAGSLRSRSVAARRNGSTSVGRVPNSCDRVLTNGRDTRSRSRFGHVPTTSNSASAARNTMPR
jgi:hypothetical protein